MSIGEEVEIVDLTFSICYLIHRTKFTLNNTFGKISVQRHRNYTIIVVTTVRLFDSWGYKEIFPHLLSVLLAILYLLTVTSEYDAISRTSFGENL